MNKCEVKLFLLEDGANIAFLYICGTFQYFVPITLTNAGTKLANSGD